MNIQQTYWLTLFHRLILAHSSLHLPGRKDSSGAVVAVPLSSDHTPMDPSEAQRINANGVGIPDIHKATSTVIAFLFDGFATCMHSVSVKHVANLQ
jgi:hypothetical protein